MDLKLIVRRRLAWSCAWKKHSKCIRFSSSSVAKENKMPNSSHGTVEAFEKSNTLFFSFCYIISSLPCYIFLTSRFSLFSFAQFFMFLFFFQFRFRVLTTISSRRVYFCGLDYWTVNRRVWFRSSFIVFLTPEILSFHDTWGDFQPSPIIGEIKLCCTRSLNVFFTYQFLIKISFN